MSAHIYTELMMQWDAALNENRKQKQNVPKKKENESKSWMFLFFIGIYSHRS
jgi:hypothetical protein